MTPEATIDTLREARMLSDADYEDGLVGRRADAEGYMSCASGTSKVRPQGAIRMKRCYATASQFTITAQRHSRVHSIGHADGNTAFAGAAR